MHIMFAGLLLSLLFPMYSFASHSTSYFGDSNCGDIVSFQMDSHAGNAYGSYALGFIAGVNFKSDRKILHDSEDLEQWVWN